MGWYNPEGGEPAYCITYVEPDPLWMRVLAWRRRD